MINNLNLLKEIIKNLDGEKRMNKKKNINLQILKVKESYGYRYALNRSTKELHLVKRKNYCGSHNLMTANLTNFIFSKIVSKNSFSNKCKYCFPKIISLGKNV